MKLRTALVRLVLLSVAPLVLFSVFLVARSLEEQKRLRNVGSQQTGRALSLAVDRQIQVSLAVLETLAKSPLLDRDDLDGFHEVCHRFTEEHRGSQIVLVHPDGRLLLDSTKPRGAPLPDLIKESKPAGSDPRYPLLPVGGAEHLHLVRTEGKASISDLHVALDSGTPVLCAAVPIFGGKKLRYVLGMTLDPDAFLGIIREQNVPDSWTVSVLDGRRRVIARTINPAAMLGRTLSSDLDRQIASEKSPAVGVTHEGVLVYHTFHRCSSAPWTVSIGAAKAAADAHGRMSVILLWAAAGGTVLLALGIALVMGRKIIQSITALTSSANRLAKGDKPTPLPLGFREVRDLHESLILAGRAARQASIEHEQRLVAEAQREESRRSNEAKDDFLAMLGHELKNPLTVIVASSRALKRSCDGNPEAARAADRIESQAMHAGRIISDLVDLSSLTLGMLRLDPEPLDLAQVAADVVAAWKSSGRLDLHDVSTDLAPAPVKADRTRVEQILSNLLDNSVKFTPPKRKIAVTVGEEDGFAVLRVRDEGQGIPPELMPRIFDLHISGDRSPRRVSMGIGLALVRNLAEIQGGRVTASSDGEGKGTEFTVRLPSSR